jgi:N-acylneuraminate cytidylyltransferase
MTSTGWSRRFRELSGYELSTGLSDMKEESNIAVIPARGGSKRIPGKNTREFCGKPIIAYSIAAAHDAGVFDRIIVSTDSTEVARAAEEFGAEVPFLRPAELAEDTTPTMPVVRHAVEWLVAAGTDVRHVCCVYPASPLVQPRWIREGLDLLSGSAAEFVFPVAAYRSCIFRALRIEDGEIRMFWPENELKRSQDLPDAYHDAGQFYWGTVKAYRSHEGFFSARSLPIVLPGHLVQDIDTPEDWARAEFLFRSLRSG